MSLPSQGTGQFLSFLTHSLGYKPRPLMSFRYYLRGHCHLILPHGFAEVPGR